MGKTIRRTIGSIFKGKDGKSDYIKLGMDVSLKKGQFLNLESKKSQLERLDLAEADGKLSEENASKARARIEKIPDFVRFEIILVTKEE